MTDIVTELRRMIAARLAQQPVRAVAADLGVPFTTLAHFMDGSIDRPRLDLCVRLARALGCEIRLHQTGTQPGTPRGKKR